MTGMERALQEARIIRDNCISSGGGRALRIVADAILEAEAHGLGRASCFLFVQSAGFPIDDPRRQAYEWAAAELDLCAQQIRAQKGKT